MSEEEYKKWVDEAFQYIEEVYDRVNQLKNVNVGSTQYIPKIDGEIELVFLGHDAHEGRGENDKLDITFAKERFYKGNGDPRYWRKCPEWKIWNNMERALWRAGFTEIMENGLISEEILNKTIVTNALLFTCGGYAKELNTRLKQDIVNDCMKLAGKLIFDVIKPRMVICSSCPLVFEPLIKNYHADIRYEVFSLKGTSRRVMRCTHKDVTVLGIPHTSYPVPLPVAAFVRDSYLGNDIGYMISNNASHSNRVFVDNKTRIKPDRLKNIIIEDSFKKSVRKEVWTDNKSFIISPHFVVRVSSTQKGYVIIRDSQFDPKNNYSKRTINNHESIVKYLETKGYGNAGATSLGEKPFRKYAEWKQGPQHVVLSILREIEELGTELEDLYNKKEI